MRIPSDARHRDSGFLAPQSGDQNLGGSKGEIRLLKREALHSYRVDYIEFCEGLETPVSH